MRPSRRGLLRGLGALSVGALAGCNGSPLGSSGPPPFVRWAPAPAETDRTPYRILGVKPGELQAVDSPWTNDIASSLPETGPLSSAIDVEAVEHVQAFGQTVAFQGGIDGPAAEEIVRGGRFEDATTVGDYTTGRAPAGALVAAKGDRVVMGRQRAGVTALVRAYEGDIGRLSSGYEAATSILRELPAATLRGVRLHDPGVVGFEDAQGEGIAVDVGEAQTTATGAVAFLPGDARPEPVTAWAASADPIDRSALETTTEGNVVVVRTTVPTADLAGMWTSFPSPSYSNAETATPQVVFEAEYEPVGEGRGRLTMTHMGGDTLSADQLSLRGTGFADVAGVDQTAPGPWQGETTDRGTVSAGVNVTVGATVDYDIRVVWESTGGETSATLFADQGPAA